MLQIFIILKSDTIYPVRKIDNSKIRRDHNAKTVDFSSFSPNDNERSMN